MKLYTMVLPSSAGGKLEKQVEKQLPDMPKARIREAFRKRDVKQNGVRVGVEAAALPSATVQVYLPEDIAITIRILYEDDNVLAVHKPAGISCVSDAHGAPSLPEILFREQRIVRENWHMPIVCHRLDNQTEGILLLAKNEKTAELLIDAFRQHQIQKRYECLVKGTPARNHDLLEGWLLKDSAAARVRVVSSERPGAKWIQTEYEVLEKGEISRLLVTLHTGRTHQIRAHMSSSGYPLLGDDVYGDRAFNRDHHARKLALCAVSLHCSDNIAVKSLRGLTLTTSPTCF